MSDYIYIIVYSYRKQQKKEPNKSTITRGKALSCEKRSCSSSKARGRALGGADVMGI